MTKRRDRVAEAVKEAVADAIRDIDDPRLGLVSVVRTEMSPDLAHAMVAVSVYGDEESVKASRAVLEAARGFVRTAVGRAVRLRHTPEIHWSFDQSIAHSQRISEILRDLGRGPGR